MNISVTNAGKRKHSPNHWYWAVWTEIEQAPDLTPEVDRKNRPYSIWNKAKPASSGFSPSRKEARRCAWAAIRLLSPERPRAYEYSWALQMLGDESANEDRPSFSRSKVGKDKWLWVVHQNRCYWESDPIAHGIAASPELAQAEAQRQVGEVAVTSNDMSEFFRSKQAASKRSQRTTKTSEAASLDFVFECHIADSDYDSATTDAITPHRIVKRTKKRIYVERQHYREDSQPAGNWRDFVVDTFVLDREEFEASGKAKGGRRWYNTFYADPATYLSERRSMAHRPECFIRLGVPVGASAAEIRSAYRRLACKTHPDAGGDADEFKQVQAWYDQAIELAAVCTA